MKEETIFSCEDVFVVKKIEDLREVRSTSSDTSQRFKEYDTKVHTLSISTVVTFFQRDSIIRMYAIYFIRII